MAKDRVIVAVQLYDSRIVVEWTIDEWIAELELLQAVTSEVTQHTLDCAGIRMTDNLKFSSLLEV